MLSRDAKKLLSAMQNAGNETGQFFPAVTLVKWLGTVSQLETAAAELERAGLVLVSPSGAVALSPMGKNFSLGDSGSAQN